jgi:hypothetical protein
MLYLGTTTFVLIIRYAGVSLGDAFGVILDFTGGVAGSMTSFVLPAAVYLKVMPTSAYFYNLAKVMAVFGIFVMFMVPIVAITSFS